MSTRRRRSSFGAPGRPRVVLVAASFVLAVLAASAAPGVASATRRGASNAAQSGGSTTTTTSKSSRGSTTAPGRIAYVTPTGDVVVAESDGSDPKVIGSGAVANAAGLSPLAWHQPGAESVTYVRNDRALVDAPVDGSPPIVYARDAVVPPDASENLVSWQSSGDFLVYVAEPTPGRIESRIIDFTTVDETHVPDNRPAGDPDRRLILEQAFSPIDPFMYQRTSDRETGREFTISIVEPLGGQPFASPFSLDDPTFSPDGRFVYAVATVGAVDQLVRIAIALPTVTPISDHDRICRPAVSPDARMVVFGAGRNCQEVWLIDADGSNPHKIADNVGGTSTFDVGDFSWSFDGQVISHAACRRVGDHTVCNGGYWDISVDGHTIKPRAAAGSVLREQRALVRPVKVTLSVQGPVPYQGSLKVGALSVGPLIDRSQTDQIDLSATDQDNPSKSLKLRLYHPPDSASFAGSLEVIDGGFDETYMIMARALPQSFGRATIRAVWLRTESFPLTAGQLTLRLER